MKTVFISRQLTEDSIFRKTLETNYFQVYGESLVVLSPVAFDEPPRTDWAFFYSQNAARFFVENINERVLFDLKLAALGIGTAAALTALGYRPQFVGDGDPVHTAAQFIGMAEGQSVLFPRARDSRQSVQRLLETRLTVLDLVIYENKPRTEFLLPQFDVLVFTSPLNARAYFAQRKWQGETTVAIGNTTANALRSLGITEVFVAESPTEEALAKRVAGLVGKA